MKVIYTGSSENQRSWGASSGNWDELVIGKEYIVADKEEHDWHTLYTLEGIKGQFNSVCFEEVPNEPTP